jgi:serine/threonine protein kinase
MSPEQAAGRWDVITPASDVYALGAVLYAILTGRPPIEVGNWPEIQQKIQRGDFPRPRAVNPAAPRALQAVCLKAMALEPEDRYPSARALADEVELWLADEPVQAYREPVVARLGRWARRHKPAVAGGIALLGTAVIALAVSDWFISRANVRTDQKASQVTNIAGMTMEQFKDLDRLMKVVDRQTKELEFMRERIRELESERRAEKK